MDEPGYFLAPYTVVNGPLTDEEWAKMYEEAGLDGKAALIQRDKARAYKEQYYINHAVCPECGYDKYSSTYIGYVLNIEHPESYKDENHVKCGHCGWKGTTHQLVRKP